ncbi:MAG: hypothetical protein ACYTEQ_19475 [Planctomycetota bacterium]|jgi:hypothetical protein
MATGETAIGSAIGPLVTIGGIAILGFVAIKYFGLDARAQEAVEVVVTVVQESAEKAREVVDEAAEVVNEKIDEGAGVIEQIPIVGPWLSEYNTITIQQGAWQSAYDWLTESGAIGVADMVVNWELELSRVYVTLDEFGNLVDKAGNIIVSATATDPDPWHIAQGMYDRAVEATRAMNETLRGYAEASFYESIEKYAGTLTLTAEEIRIGLDAAISGGPIAEATDRALDFARRVKELADAAINDGTRIIDQSPDGHSPIPLPEDAPFIDHMIWQFNEYLRLGLGASTAKSKVEDLIQNYMPSILDEFRARIG